MPDHDSVEWDVSTHGPAPVLMDPETDEPAQTDLGYDVVGTPVSPTTENVGSPQPEVGPDGTVPTVNGGEQDVQGGTPDPDAPTVTPEPTDPDADPDSAGQHSA